MSEPVFDIHYVTKVVNRRQPVFGLDPRFPQYVIENLEFYRNKFGFKLYGFVIMPDHIHDIIDTCGKTPIQKIFEDMDKFIARQVLSDLKSQNHTILQKLAIDLPPRRGHKRHEYRLFQKGDYDFQVITAGKLIEKLKYMHENPVQAKLVDKPEDYPFSSARNYILDDDSVIRLDKLPI